MTDETHRRRPPESGSEVARAGAVAGAAAFALGFALTYVVEGQRVWSPSEPVYRQFFFGIDTSMRATAGPAGPLPDAFQFAAWQFHGLHRAGVGFGETPAPARYLVFVPPLLLLAAGSLVVLRTGAGSPAAATRRGATVVLGYLPLAVLTRRTSVWEAPESVLVEQEGITSEVYPLGSVGVEALEALARTGFAFPLAFGATGGLLAFAFFERRDRLRGREFPKRSGAFGTGAFVLGWTATYAGIRAGILDGVEAGAFEDALPYLGHELLVDGVRPDSFLVATWRYHAFHGAPLDAEGIETATNGVRRTTMVGADGYAFLLSAAVVTLAGGALVARSKISDPRVAAVHGASVVVGYLPLAALTAALATWTPGPGDEAVYGVAFLDAVHLTGLGVPVVFGAVGGVAVAATRAATATVLARWGTAS